MVLMFHPTLQSCLVTSIYILIELITTSPKISYPALTALGLLIFPPTQKVIFWTSSVARLSLPQIILELTFPSPTTCSFHLISPGHLAPLKMGLSPSPIWHLDLDPNSANLKAKPNSLPIPLVKASNHSLIPLITAIVHSSLTAIITPILKKPGPNNLNNILSYLQSSFSFQNPQRKKKILRLMITLSIISMSSSSLAFSHSKALKQLLSRSLMTSSLLPTLDPSPSSSSTAAFDTISHTAGPISHHSII